MTAIVLRDTPETQTHTPETHTSALGSMYRFALGAGPAAMLIATTLPGSATANTYPQGSMPMWATITPYTERTAAGPTGQIDFMPAESAAEAIMEIRRRSGLTWEELGDLFDVSRRSVHHWANGKSLASRHDRMIRKMLAAVRHLDQGDQVATRSLLLAVDHVRGSSTLDLLKDGRFDEAVGRIEGVLAPEPQRIPLSSTSWVARRPQAPVLLLEAEQERPDIPAQVCTVRPKRTPKTTG